MFDKDGSVKFCWEFQIKSGGKSNAILVTMIKKTMEEIVSAIVVARSAVVCKPSSAAIPFAEKQTLRLSFSWNIHYDSRRLSITLSFDR